MNNGIQAAGYGPPPGGGGYGAPPGGGGYGAPPGAPPGGGGFGPPPGGMPPGGAPPGGYGAPPPGFGPPGGGFPPPGGPMMPGAGGDVNTTLPLILAILMIFPCCNLFFGVPALIFAIQAGNLKKTGDLEGARGKAKITYIIAGIGFALYIIGNILYWLLLAANS